VRRIGIEETASTRAIAIVRRARWRNLRVLVEKIVPAGNAPRINLGSCSNGRHHRLDAQNINGRSQIVDERCEAELSPDIVEALHQEGALVHPLLDAAEGMLDDLAMPIEFPASPSGELASIYSFEK
jgi:hypothetical protein